MVAGGVLGSVLGSGIARSEGLLGGVAGAVGGSILGQQVAKSLNQVPGMELEIKKESGKVIAVVQKMDKRFVIGQRVRVATSNRGTTVSTV